MTHSCPVCTSTHITGTIEIPDTPVYCNVLWPSREAALQASKGDIDLCYCNDCGHVFNRAFDPALMDYTEDYENSLHFSPRFNDYANALADRLISTYDVRGKDIIEIGCGKGDFLTLLCEKGANQGFGFDRSVEQDRHTRTRSESVTFINDFYDQKYADRNADLIVCRHVLEHIQDPLSFLQNLRSTLDSHPDTILYFEVPNVLYTLKDMGIWDLIYEHCAYFSPSSLQTVFRAAGFDLLASGDAFDGQFLYIETKPSGKRKDSDSVEYNLNELADYVKKFDQNYAEKVSDWSKRLQAVVSEGKDAVIWGAGSKGITFLNVMETQGKIEYVVDLNPHKHGMFAPGTGQEVVDPEFLRQFSPHVVFVMNSIYKDEIANSLAQLGVHAELICV